MEKKKIVLFSLLGLLIVIMISMMLLVFKKDKGGEEIAAHEPQFLNLEQKKEFGLKPETKAQVFYDDEGNLIYKIIRDDKDIVSNPEEFKN